MGPGPGRGGRCEREDSGSTCGGTDVRHLIWCLGGGVSCTLRGRALPLTVMFRDVPLVRVSKEFNESFSGALPEGPLTELVSMGSVCDGGEGGRCERVWCFGGGGGVAAGVNLRQCQCQDDMHRLVSMRPVWGGGGQQGVKRQSCCH
jgi:hypothetical protein